MELSELIKGIRGLDNSALALATERQKSLIKPMGSLGALEDISIQIAGITGHVKNLSDKKILFLFGADNGVYEEGVAASPQHFTRTLMLDYADDKKCAINVICKQNNVTLKLIDVGIIGEINHPKVDNRKLMSNGTNNFAKEKALDIEVVKKALLIGAEYAEYAVRNGFNLIGNGEIGMANTTTSSACIMAAASIYNTNIAVGRGAGLDDESYQKKKSVIYSALKKYQLDKDGIVNKNNPLEILSCVGGLDIAAMTGLYLGAAYHRIPIVIDGLISISAALLAYLINPLSKEYMIASHISAEPAYLIAIDKLGLKPILSLRMRLGEGSGCPIAMSVIDTALAVMSEMTTFDELKVETEYRKNITT